MPRPTRASQLLTVVCVIGIVAAAALAGQVNAPAGGDAWTDGAAGAWLWLLAGLVPVTIAGVVVAGRVTHRGARLPLIVAATVVLATVVGELMHVTDLPVNRRAVGVGGAALDVIAVVLAAGMVGTLLRPSFAPWIGSVAAGAGAVAAVLVVGIAPTAEPSLLPAVSPLQVPSLTFFAERGETVLLALSLAPLVAAALLVWALLRASLDERRRVRWLALSLVTAVGAIALVQLVRLLGLVNVGDGFLVAVPRAVIWTAVAAGVAATIVQPELGDAAVAVRRVAVGVSLVSILGAAAGIAWFAADATTSAIVPGAPAAAAVLTVAALVLPLRDRLEHVADRWLFGEIGSDARLIDSFGQAADHAGRNEVLELLVTTARRCTRLRWARASTYGFAPVEASAGVGEGERPVAVALVALIEGGEELGVLECGPKRGGPLSTHDRQLLGALGREAALRLRTVSQADELQARLKEIERQSAEIAASRTRIVEAQDEERRRIERDIHDGVQQDLASLIGKLRVALNQLERSPTEAGATIADAQDDVRRALAELRSLAQGIHPAVLDDYGVVRAIDARASRLPLEVTVDAAPELAGRRFDRSIEGAAYFVASEALANIVKHAEATSVAVCISLEGDRLLLRISDDGHGIGRDAVPGSGLTNMADRAAALGGQVTIESLSSGGTAVVAELPIEPTVAV